MCIRDRYMGIEETKGEGVRYDRNRKLSENETGPTSNKRKEDKGHKERDRPAKKSFKESNPFQAEKSLDRWIELTPSLQELRDKRSYTLLGATISRDYVGVLATFKGINKFGKGEEKAKEKMKEAEKVVNRILWDKSLRQEDFTVGYEDRFLGIMEISFDEYTRSDIQYHRIKYFKKKNEVVWDRSSRLCNIQMLSLIHI
eukprot:TRINITY_DN31012_c0_g1_i1.p1 TRINITY_DN31012_c0_g1~~TRINITY_DN31012_c0_g1_i1.p1  ORF type:complete len:226 (+),score=65.81 TRINITY_DN31012_c0_g1_i1:81-680(+)